MVPTERAAGLYMADKTSPCEWLHKTGLWQGNAVAGWTWKEKKIKQGATENASQHSAFQGWETAPAWCKFPPAATEIKLRKQISHTLPRAPTVLFPRGIPKCYLSLVPSQLRSFVFWKGFSCSVRKEWKWENGRADEECTLWGMLLLRDSLGCRSRGARWVCELWEAAVLSCCPLGKRGSSRMRQQVLQGEMWDQPQPCLPPASTLPANTTRDQGFPWCGKMP